MKMKSVIHIRLDRTFDRYKNRIKISGVPTVGYLRTFDDASTSHISLGVGKVILRDASGVGLRGGCIEGSYVGLIDKRVRFIRHINV